MKKYTITSPFSDLTNCSILTLLQKNNVSILNNNSVYFEANYNENGYIYIIDGETTVNIDDISKISVNIDAVDKQIIMTYDNTYLLKLSYDDFRDFILKALIQLGSLFKSNDINNEVTYIQIENNKSNKYYIHTTHNNKEYEGMVYELFTKTYYLYNLSKDDEGKYEQTYISHTISDNSQKDLLLKNIQNVYINNINYYQQQIESYSYDDTNTLTITIDKSKILCKIFDKNNSIYKINFINYNEEDNIISITMSKNSNQIRDSWNSEIYMNLNLKKDTNLNPVFIIKDENKYLQELNSKILPNSDIKNKLCDCYYTNYNIDNENFDYEFNFNANSIMFSYTGTNYSEDLIGYDKENSKIQIYEKTLKIAPTSFGFNTSAEGTNYFKFKELNSSVSDIDLGSMIKKVDVGSNSFVSDINFYRDDSSYRLVVNNTEYIMYDYQIFESVLDDSNEDIFGIKHIISDTETLNIFFDNLLLLFNEPNLVLYLDEINIDGIVYESNEISYIKIDPQLYGDVVYIRQYLKDQVNYIINSYSYIGFQGK